MTCDPIVEQETESSARPLGLPESVPALTTFYLYLTEGCNLKCKHCWIAPYYEPGVPTPGTYLDLGLLTKAVKEAKPLGLNSVKLSGGEPTLHPEFLEVVDYLTTEGLNLNLETNGTLITNDLAVHLKQNTNVRFVSVSIDGPNPDVHDSFRGVAGSFDAAVAGIRYLVSVGYRPQLIMSLHRDNLHYTDEVINLAVELGAGSIKFNPISRMGRGVAIHKNHLALGVDEILALAHSVREKRGEYSELKLIFPTPPAFYTASEIARFGLDGRCHVLHILGILGSGDMALCGIGRTIPELSYGNLKNNSVADAWLYSPAIRNLRFQLTQPYPGICNSCIHAKHCLTYCPAENYQVSGRLISPAWLCEEAYNTGQFPLSRLRSDEEIR